MLNLTNFMYSTYLNFQTFAQIFAYGIVLYHPLKNIKVVIYGSKLTEN